MDSQTTPDPLDDLFAEANAWFFRLRADDVSETDQRNFLLWLATSPAHAQAWDEAQELFMLLELPAQEILQSQRSAATNAVESPRPPVRRHRIGPARVAIAAMLCVAVLAAYLKPSLLKALQSDFATATGEQRVVTLSDGSRLLLNTDTAISVDIQESRRTVRLLDGEVFFEVSHAPQRPFIVIAGNIHTKVTGTAFSVKHGEDGVTVTVAEGRVETGGDSPDRTVTPLTPGQSARYRAEQAAIVETADLRRTLAWRQGQLVFVQTPLETVVAEINRYRPGRLLIANPRLKPLPVTAVFNVNGLDEAATMLERSLGIHSQKLTDYLVLLD
ncbi:FecR family protein [Methylococcaceae bacterium WWC4]|nr:FecR family protein [Methylococcaceae bacterium WWC4]